MEQRKPQPDVAKEMSQELRGLRASSNDSAGRGSQDLDLGRDASKSSGRATNPVKLPGNSGTRCSEKVGPFSINYIKTRAWYSFFKIQEMVSL